MAAEEIISRAEHEEFARRMEEEHKRMDVRVTSLEASIKEMTQLTASVEKLAVNMESMCREQEKQGQRLQALEAKDGEMWRSVVKYAVTAAVGVIVGYALTAIGW